jgi:GNAT superfamily N-acetyltransferase
MATPGEVRYPTTDLTLAQRLEGAEAATNIAFVQGRGRVAPVVGATYLHVGGVAAMFDGPESPLTQTFGLGVFGPVETAVFERLEAFFLSRSSPVHHEVSSLADPAISDQLHARGYVPTEVSTVLVRPTALPVQWNGVVSVREIRPEEGPLWSRTAGEGWGSESPELGAFIRAMGEALVQSDGVHCFLAEVDGRPAATGALSLSGGVALLAGASTVPHARRRGAQLALLAARLEVARSRGADLAMMVAQPGSASQRNAERHGFRTAYTRMKWRLGTPDEGTGSAHAVLVPPGGTPPGLQR